jgi:opacity protein-like surface antigen
MKKFITAAVIATLAISSPASAAVNFNADNGTGFVGKGDIQLGFGWNNKQLQDGAKNVTFRLKTHERYSVTCEWETVTGGKNSKVIEHSITKTANVNSNIAVSVEPRTRNQITGFNLTGFGAGTTGGTEPVIGGGCPGESEKGEITAFTLVDSSGGLEAQHNGVTIDLPNTPVL